MEAGAGGAVVSASTGARTASAQGWPRKMLDGHLFQLLLTTALFPSILGTGTAPFLPLLLPELFPDGALALEGCSPEAQKGGWGVCAGRQ